ncbi:MAG: ribosomal protein S18-alanine N-acetyltransferase [Oscillospiraceae bacterium]|nr:ribosomal protein S18-alanine N-acetyltransferase [Oscillospiraceae bacterium]
MSVIIKSADLCHLDEILRIERESFPNPWSKNHLRQRILDPASLVYVAAETNYAPVWADAPSGPPDRLLGFAILQIIGPEAELHNMAVDQTAKRQGIGQLLLSSLIQAAQGRGVEVIHLEVRASNAPAIALYEGLGFQRMGLRRGYYQVPLEDAVLMRLGVG